MSTTAEAQSAHRSPMTLPLSDIADKPVEQVGGKGLGLGRLIRGGMPVPAGFVVTAAAYRYSVARAGLNGAINAVLRDVTDLESATRASTAIQSLFDTLELPDDVAGAVCDGYRALGDRAPVAVRSSASAEDLAEASFAGQQETYLWVQDQSNVLRSLTQCWASLFTTRAILYRSRLCPEPSDLAMAVVIQRMVQADAAGVLMTLEPVTGDNGIICIEAGLGLGEGVVRGDVQVDRYRIRKSDMCTEHSAIAAKLHAYRFDPACNAVVLGNVDPRIAHSPCLSHNDIQRLVLLALDTERAFGMPVDIEWAIDENGQIHLLQARPETVWSQRPGPTVAGAHLPTPTEHALSGTSDGAYLTGIGASTGTVEGIVRVVVEPSGDLQPGEILVVPVTDPTWVSLMIDSSAVVVDSGGVLSHAAIIARELSIPCVVNTQLGTQILRTGDRVKVDGQAGTVELLERTATASG